MQTIAQLILTCYNYKEVNKMPQVIFKKNEFRRQY